MSEAPKTATHIRQDDFRIDLRRRRADQLFAWIMDEIDAER
jgi:hypothetical protein